MMAMMASGTKGVQGAKKVVSPRKAVAKRNSPLKREGDRVILFTTGKNKDIEHLTPVSKIVTKGLSSFQADSGSNTSLAQTSQLKPKIAEMVVPEECYQDVVEPPKEAYI